MDCIFCRIVAGQIPSDIIYQDDPQSPVHLLIIPKKHFTSLLDLTGADATLMGNMVGVANKLAREEGIAESGYRLVINCGQQGGQLVPHLHLHVLGGRQLSGKLG